MLLLRKVRQTDREQLRHWRNAPEVSTYMFTDHYITAEEHQQWFASMLKNDSCSYWIIEYKGESVGTVSINDINNAHQRCTTSLYIVPTSCRGHGIGTVVKTVILDHCFDQLGMYKVYSEHVDFNKIIIALNKSLGFREDGRLRSHVVKNNARVDVVSMSILCHEWKEKRPFVERKLKKRGWKKNHWPAVSV
nr:UDP-4-amino-4,6-dideoxy-N-acetyl-beta-L-altrosamine N-acetyltransferase [Evansella caseinilytica]